MISKNKIKFLIALILIFVNNESNMTFLKNLLHIIIYLNSNINRYFYKKKKTINRHFFHEPKR